jgi:putative transposase
MCKVLKVHRSGYYAWLRDPQCQRKKDDAYLLGYVKQFWLESGGVYGDLKITMDMKDLGRNLWTQSYTQTNERRRYQCPTRL